MSPSALPLHAINQKALPSFPLKYLWSSAVLEDTAHTAFHGKHDLGPHFRSCHSVPYTWTSHSMKLLLFPHWSCCFPSHAYAHTGTAFPYHGLVPLANFFLSILQNTIQAPSTNTPWTICQTKLLLFFHVLRICSTHRYQCSYNYWLAFSLN